MDIDWTKSMSQTYHFYKVNPKTWMDEKKLENFESAQITYDSNDETICHASLTGEIIEDEFYIRIYLVCVQFGYTYKFPLGTFLVMSQASGYDGKRFSYSTNAYSPLIELKEKYPPIGYSMVCRKNEVLTNVLKILSGHIRAPVIQNINTSISDSEEFVFTAEFDDTWLTYIISILQSINYHLGITAKGEVYVEPDITNINAAKPVWTYNDDEVSILLPDITNEYDIYGVPNVVELLHSNAITNYFVRAVNDDPDSKTSTVSRGREIVYRTNTDEGYILSEEQVQKLALSILKKQSEVEHVLEYSHAYCPVRIGDGIMMNYRKSGYRNIKAFVTSQIIDCKSGCTVTETAKYTTYLWKGGN